MSDITIDKLLDAVNVISEAIKQDSSYAYRWHKYIAESLIDSDVDYLLANEAAARFMFDMFQVDTLTGQEPVRNGREVTHEES
jgi:hypothetical protein